MNSDEVEYVQRPPVHNLSHSILIADIKSAVKTHPITHSVTIKTPTTPTTPKTPKTPESPAKSIKRSSSSSNDLLYERDRFRARHQNLNSECDVCTGVTLKTKKLNLCGNETEYITGDIEEGDMEEEKAIEAESRIEQDLEILQTDSIEPDEANDSVIRDIDEFVFSNEISKDEILAELPTESPIASEKKSLQSSPAQSEDPILGEALLIESAVLVDETSPKQKNTLHTLKQNIILDPSIINLELPKPDLDHPPLDIELLSGPMSSSSPIKPIRLAKSFPLSIPLPLGDLKPCNISAEDLSPLDPRSSLSKYGSGRCKTITQTQLSAVFKWYFSSSLPPTQVMFPWLHGLNEENFAQRSFFLFQTSQKTVVRKPDGVRFLMCVNTNETDDDPPYHLLKNTVNITEILSRIDVTRTQVYEMLDEIFTKVFGTEKDPVLIETLKDDCVKTNLFPLFLNLDPKNGISLRNFHIQVCKLASCSDFVVYPLKGGDVQRYARILWLAQRYEAALHKKTCSYNVFVLEGYECAPREIVRLDAQVVYENYRNERNFDKNTNGTKIEEPQNIEISTFETDSKIKRSQKELVEESDDSPTEISSEIASDIASASDYQLKEKIETCKMSAASQISKNVWTGNSWDYQIMMCFLAEHDMSYRENIPQETYSSPKCSPGADTVESTSPESLSFPSSPADSLPASSSSSYSTSSETASFHPLENLPMPKSNWRLFINCRNGATFPSYATLRDLLFKYSISSHSLDDESDEHNLLEFPPSGSIGIGDCQKENLMAIINTCKLIYLFSAASSPNSQSTLIHCSDGYTESSLLTLCFLIYANDFSLQNAILDLHINHSRPFYIFNSDVLILQKLEPFLRKFSPKKLAKVEWSQFEVLVDSEISELLLGSRSTNQVSKSLRLGYIANDSDSSDEEVAPTVSADDWVTNVEGSLPSRILPYLYLGSLTHANCLPLLRDLGITHVISVGEQLDWLAGANFRRNKIKTVETIDDGGIQLFTLQDAPVQYVMKVNNLQDDGIDELTRSLPQILDYIDKEHTRGKILVHCRVGVSRSATVVIAEVMGRLNLSLPDAYLYVRVRRLNIIIQPNLRFMYELFKWDELEKSKKLDKSKQSKSALRDIDWFMMCREIMKLNIPYLRGM